MFTCMWLRVQSQCPPRYVRASAGGGALSAGRAAHDVMPAGLGAPALARRQVTSSLAPT